MKAWYRGLAGLVLLGWGAAAWAAPETLSFSYKEFFALPFKAPVAIAAASVECGAVSLEKEDVFAKPNALRLDTGKNAAAYTGVNFQVPRGQLDAYREKKLALRMKIKWVSGSGQIGSTMRCFADGKFLLGTPGISYQGEKGEWGDFVVRGVIPANKEIGHVDFQTGARKTADPAVFIIDECVLTVEDAGDDAAPQTADKAPTGPTLVAMIPLSDNKPAFIASNGAAAATIVLGAEPTSVEQYAAQELAEHLELSVGAKFAVVKEGAPTQGLAIHIGNTSLARQFALAPVMLKQDHWVVWRAGNALILSGGDASSPFNPVSSVQQACGTLFAVYEFLERAVGVRWYWPGELGRVVPRKADLSVGNIQWDGSPSYETRFALYPTHGDREIPRDEVWKWWRRQRWGGLGGSPIGNHSFNAWPERFGKEHPEWFALQPNGQRLNEHKLAHLCFSNPEVFAQTVKDVREFFDKNPAVRYKAVMPGDSLAGYYCQCAPCQAASRPEEGPSGIYSNAIWSFVNAVAAEVAKTHPDRFITCASYTNYSKPPKGIQLLPNVAVTLCRSSFPLAIYKPGVKVWYSQSIDVWRDKAANLYVWDYWNSPRYKKGVYGAPSIVPHAIKEWFVLDHGKVKGHALELCNRDSEGISTRGFTDWMFDAVNIYVGMRLLWNMDTDVDQVLDEYYADLYGPAAHLVKMFHEKMEAAYLNPKTKGAPNFQWDWNTCWRETYPAPFVKEVMGHLREAEALTRGQEPYHARVVKTLNGFLPFEKASKQFHEAATRDVKNTELVLPLSTAAPAIDGDLNDAIWAKAVKADGFVDSFNGPAPRAQTQMLLLRDAKTLYVGIRAELPDGRVKQELPANSVDRWVWEEDSCEVFFAQGKAMQLFAVGPDNLLSDCLHPDMDQPFKLDMFKWNCPGLQYKSRTGNKEWTAELAIPLASLTIAAPSKEAPWNVNFGRSHHYSTGAGKAWQRELTAWRPTYGSFHKVEHYGTLYFD